MSLQTIHEVKTLKARKEILKEYLHTHAEGPLPENDDMILKWLFETYYTPISGQVKYPTSDIEYFFLTTSDYGKPCFRIRRKDGIEDNVSYMNMAGEKRNDKDPLRQALRDTVKPQIEEFKRSNPLNPTALCPIQNIPLGRDAEVDHYNPTFKELVEEWMKENPTPKVLWGPRGSSKYLLDEPYQTSWFAFHKEKAHLRWLSKEGNKRAHRL